MMQTSKDDTLSWGTAGVRDKVDTREGTSLLGHNRGHYPAGDEDQRSDMDRSPASEDSAHLECPRVK